MPPVRPLTLLWLRQRLALRTALVLLMGWVMGCGNPSALERFSAQAQPQVPSLSSMEARSPGATHSTQAEILQALGQAQVIYLGETHDSLADHQAQLAIIEALVEQGKSVAIAFEMFQRPFQSVLDDYAGGKIDEATLRRESEYDERWGFDWELYAPILRYGKAQSLPLLAANTPREITRQVARQGLDSLDTQARSQIPPFAEIRRDNEDYRAFVAQAFLGFHGHGGHGTSGAGDVDPGRMKQAFERFFAAQVLWDETMAETVATYLRANPNRTVVVLAGQGHVIYGWGIPSRVARRLAAEQDSELRQVTVLLNPSDEMRQVGEGAIADYFWLSQ